MKDKKIETNKETKTLARIKERINKHTEKTKIQRNKERQT